jgi:hypothetical protein
MHDLLCDEAKPKAPDATAPGLKGSIDGQRWKPKASRTGGLDISANPGSGRKWR